MSGVRKTITSKDELCPVCGSRLKTVYGSMPLKMDYDTWLSTDKLTKKFVTSKLVQLASKDIKVTKVSCSNCGHVYGEK